MSVLSPGSGFRAGKQCHWLGLVIDLRGTLAQDQAPGKPSETWPELAGGVTKCSRGAKEGVLGMRPGVTEVGETINLKQSTPRTTLFVCWKLSECIDKKLVVQ